MLCLMVLFLKLKFCHFLRYALFSKFSWPNSCKWDYRFMLATKMPYSCCGVPLRFIFIALHCDSAYVLHALPVMQSLVVGFGAVIFCKSQWTPFRKRSTNTQYEIVQLEYTSTYTTSHYFCIFLSIFVVSYGSFTTRLPPFLTHSTPQKKTKVWWDYRLLYMHSITTPNRL